MAKFLKFIVNTIMIVAIVVAASLLIPPFAGVTTLIVDDIEMETNLEIGSVTYAWGVDAGELSVGDKILLQEDDDMLYSISGVDGSEFVLEDTLSMDGEMVTKELQGVIDKVVLTVPVLGYVSMALRTVEGLIIVGLSVVFVIILFILSEIWRKEEEEDWEEQEESEESDNKDNADKKEVSQMNNPNSEISSEKDESAGETATEAVSVQKEDSVEKEEALVVSDEYVQVEKDLFEETSNFLASDIANMMGLQEQKEQKDPEEALRKALEQEVFKGTKEKVLAIPYYTKEELLEKAKAMGDEPELVMDEVSGVTFLDYSDVL